MKVQQGKILKMFELISAILEILNSIGNNL